MGKLKGLFWFLVIAFVIYSFAVWFIDQPGGAADLLRAIGSGIGDMRDALGIFFSELTK